MKLVIAGCEYAGKSTLVKQIRKWWTNVTGYKLSYHDHFTFYGGGSQMRPPPGQAYVSDDELEKAKALGPAMKEQLQRYLIDFHLGVEWTKREDWIMVGFHIEEAVYAPLYYGYGYPNTYGDRGKFARRRDHIIIEYFPGTVLVLVKASPDEISRRMKENPHPDNVIKEENIEYVLKRFDEEYEHSIINPRFVLDTTGVTVKETLRQFIESMIPHFSPIDILKMLHYEKLKNQSL